jgi:hypothetical protein
LVRHLPSASPVLAAALFAGWLLPSRLLALGVPLLALGISDAVLGTYDARVMAVVYAASALPVCLRGFLGPRLSAARIGLGTVGCALCFYVSSNLAWWGFGALYPHTLGGLLDCYVAALPFLRNELLGDCAWSLVFFGGYAAVTSLRPGWSARPARAEQDETLLVPGTR